MEATIITEATPTEFFFAHPDIWTELCANLNKLGNAVWVPLYENGALIGVQKIREHSVNRLLLAGYRVGVY